MATLNPDINGLDKTSLIFQLYDKLYNGMVDANKTVPLDPSSLGDKEADINKAISDYSNILMQNSAYNTAKSILDVVLKGGGGINIFTYVRTSQTVTDDNAIISALGGKTPTNGNIVIITDKNSDSTIDYGKTGFVYNGSAWENLNGRVDANNVIIRGDITLSGNYTSVGNINKGNAATAKLETDGLSVQGLLNKIFSKILEPSVNQPYISSFSLTASSSGQSSVEVGTRYQPRWSIGFYKGSYTYGPDTSVSVTSYKVVNSSNTIIGESSSGTASETITQTEDYYRATATIHHSSGSQPNNNMGAPSSTVTGILEGDKSAYASIGGYRKIFYGYESSSPLEINSSLIRRLTSVQNSSYNIPFNENTTAKRIIIAAPKGTRNISKVIMPSSSNADVTSEFKKTSPVQVFGANELYPIDYDIWVYEPATMAGTYQVTIS